ncbi:hypothetical protein GXB85_15320 [Cellulomonas sp. APG4]|uniref:hypothetical protein n=1 Tax=Cellulomonas sp. APG4 TaxID=1538656 RepID=UPI00137A6AEC|nr:hypothetical protein [Cellulomonas sp. APG4]NCT92310.1 hypothetical protein [Cellulomonas sp. APG4]
MTAAHARGPWRVASSTLHALVVEGGGLASLTAGEVELVQHAASAFEPGLVQLWLREGAAGTVIPLLGAGSPSRVTVHDDGVGYVGEHAGLRWDVRWVLHPERSAWAWHVAVTATGGPREVDLVHAHDVALAAPGALRANELYVSQYLDVSPLDRPTGTALAVRQNLAQAGRTPWCVLACDARVAGWATDALDVHGLAARAGAPSGPTGDLPSRRRQHEHTLATLQTERVRLEPGTPWRVTFAGLLVADHPAPTTPDDATYAREALELAHTTAAWEPPSGAEAHEAPRSVYTVRTAAHVARPGAATADVRVREVPDLTEAELQTGWPGEWRVVERADDGRLLSFFAGDEHVVTRAKELAVLRPHGTILRTGDRAEPDPAGLTTTAWMTGSPASYLTRGHATKGRVLTTVRGYLNLHRAYGLRVLVEDGDAWHLLDLPLVHATTLDGARWVHRLGAGGPRVEVRTHVPADEHVVRLRVTVDGAPRRVLLALHLATPDEPLPPRGSEPPAVETTPDGVVVRVEAGGEPLLLAVRASTPLHAGDDGPLFDDGVSRQGGVVTLTTEPVPVLDLELQVHEPGGPAVGAAVAAAGLADGAPDTAPAHGPDGPASSSAWWPSVTSLRVEADGPARAEVDALDAALPWLVRDALVHHLSPRGLEQYTGGAWGTRDVTQGPLELLLALDRTDDARTLLRTVLAAQSDDGSWPQAFGFVPGDEEFRHEPPHGDVVHWPVLAVGRLLLATADASLLDEQVGWFGGAAPASVLEHLDRALARARAGALPGTHLVAYGHGDWNDSLQPAEPEMATTLVSTWTVVLHHQALRTLADGLEAAGGHDERVARLRAEAAEVAADLHRHLVVDGELTGYAQLEPAADGVRVRRYLVHPRDTETGLRRGALQMIHAVGDGVLDRAGAAHHVDLVRTHLMGVDGVRLFDRPPGYHGGQMRHFQRAETATFVGREIGLMYVHAHLRWCEAMAHWGDPEALWAGVRQVLATDPTHVPGARRRQATAYASSSDAAVADRAEFAARYGDVLTGATGLEGGWRIYSSGPGVLVRVLTQSLLGVRRRGASVEIDPVLPAHLDGLRATVPLDGRTLRVRYRVGGRGVGPTALRVAGRDLPARRVEHPYRTGGLVVALADLADALDGSHELEVKLP